MEKLAFVFLFIMFYLSCDDSVPGNKYDDIPLEDEVILDSDLIVKVDPRIELLSVVQNYTSWAEKRHTKYESRFKSEIQDYFDAYSDHEAIQRSQEMTNIGFSYDAPPNYVLYHGNPPEFKQVIDYSDYLISRAGSKAKLESFAEELRNFAVEADFNSFFESQKAYFRKIENDIKRTIGEKDYIGIIENYYGLEQNSYTVIPASLFHHGGYGALIESAEGKNVYNICGPVSSSEGIPSFGDEASFQYILLHEFSHSFVNPLSENHRSELNRFSSLYNPIRSQMENMAYGNWEICVNEHLVRTNVARIFNQIQSNEVKDSILKSEYDKGFIYIYGLDSLMQIYKMNRTEYPSFTVFYPEILKYFEAVDK